MRQLQRRIALKEPDNFHWDFWILLQFYLEWTNHLFTRRIQLASAIGGGGSARLDRARRAMGKQRTRSLRRIGARLRFEMAGFDCDYGSEFLNTAVKRHAYHLWYCGWNHGDFALIFGDPHPRKTFYRWFAVGDRNAL